MTCGECGDFIQCQECECGMCRELTDWYAGKYVWTATDEECICGD